MLKNKDMKELKDKILEVVNSNGKIPISIQSICNRFNQDKTDVKNAFIELINEEKVRHYAGNLFEYSFLIIKK